MCIHLKHINLTCILLALIVDTQLAVKTVVEWMLRRSFQILGCLSLVTRTAAVASVCRPPVNYYSNMAGEKGPLVGVKYLR